MNARELSKAAFVEAEKQIDESAQLLAQNEGVIAAFKATENPDSDFPVFNRFVQAHRGQLVSLKQQKLPSEIAKPK